MFKVTSMCQKFKYSAEVPLDHSQEWTFICTENPLIARSSLQEYVLYLYVVLSRPCIASRLPLPGYVPTTTLHPACLRST
jgi:hypothetical protein